MAQTVLTVSDAEIKGYDRQLAPLPQEEYEKPRRNLFSRTPDFEKSLDDPRMLDMLKASSPEVRKDEDLMLKAIQKDARALAQADPSLRNDPDFCVKAISASKDGQAFTQLSDEMKKNETCQACYAAYMVRGEQPDRVNGETVMLTRYQFDKDMQFKPEKYGEIYQRKIDGAMSGMSTETIRKIPGSSYLVAAEAEARNNPELRQQLDEAKRRTWELPRNVDRVLQMSQSEIGVDGHTREILDTASQHSKALKQKIYDNQEQLWLHDLTNKDKNGNIARMIQAEKDLELLAVSDRERSRLKDSQAIVQDFNKYVSLEAMNRLNDEFNKQALQIERQLKTKAEIESQEQFIAMVKAKEKKELEAVSQRADSLVQRVQDDPTIQMREKREMERIIRENEAKQQRTIKMHHSIREPSITDEFDREEEAKREEKIEHAVKRAKEKEMLLAYQKASAIALIYGMAADGEISPDDAALSVARIQSIPNMSKASATLENVGKLGDIQNDYDNARALDKAQALTHAVESGLSTVYVTEAELREKIIESGLDEQSRDNRAYEGSKEQMKEEKEREKEEQERQEELQCHEMSYRPRKKK